MVFVLTHQLAITAVEQDDAALGVVEAEAVSHVIERSVQLGRFFACKCFGALAHRQQLLTLGHVLVRGYPAAALQRLAGDAYEPAVLGRPYDAELLAFDEAFGDATEDFVYILEKRSGLSSQHQQVAKG